MFYPDEALARTTPRGRMVLNAVLGELLPRGS